ASGDVVKIAPGEYDGFTIEDKDGRADAPIVIRGAAGVRIVRPGPTPVRPPWNGLAHARAWSHWPYGIAVLRSSWIVIDDIEVVGMPDGVPGVHRGGAGVRLDVCRHVTVRRVRADNNGRWGIFSAFCDDLVVEDCEASRSHSEHGIYLSNSGD